MNPSAPIAVVAEYNLLERLDPAGPGELYRARDTRHGRTVIVRLLSPVSEAETSVLLTQARSLAALSHQNAVTVFNAGVHEDGVFIAFEHVHGTSLRAEMAGRQMNVRRAVELTIQIADAVAEAHAVGFVHSGLSPDGITISAKGHAKIPAFHLATVLGFRGDGDAATLIDYRSPEEDRGEPADERSDVYSIGAVLYEMLTARRPMARGASAPGSTNARVPKDLDSLVLKAVAPNPARRFQTAAELAAALRAVLPALDRPDVFADIRTGESEGATLGRIVVMTVAILGGLGLVAWWLTRS